VKPKKAYKKGKVFPRTIMNSPNKSKKKKNKAREKKEKKKKGYKALSENPDRGKQKIFFLKKRSKEKSGRLKQFCRNFVL
jgi:hypothetical protein